WGIRSQAAAQEAVEPVLPLPGYQGLPERRTVERCPTPDPGVHLQRLVALHLVDVHDVPLVQDAEVDGFLGRQHETPEERRRRLAARAGAGVEWADLEGLEPQAVPFGLGVLADVAA